MASYLLKKESIEILNQMGVENYSEKLVCPILRVLQMRHKDLDITQAVIVIKDVLHA